jgi:hypothetical protein
MRFAYMDSQGNEVTIPSVDALALRIELGAISADTELYDAQADRWGPAHTHDIFHTLSRDAEEEGFVAPPPAMAPPTPAIDPPPAMESPPAKEAEPGHQPERSLDPVAEEPEADIGVDDLDLSLTDAGEKSLGNMGLDLAPEVAAGASGDEDGGFDFGDFSGLIEEELSFGTEVEPEEDGMRCRRIWVVDWMCRWTWRVTGWTWGRRWTTQAESNPGAPREPSRSTRLVGR